MTTGWFPDKPLKTEVEKEEGLEGIVIAIM